MSLFAFVDLAEGWVELNELPPLTSEQLDYAAVALAEEAGSAMERVYKEVTAAGWEPPSLPGPCRLCQRPRDGRLEYCREHAWLAGVAAESRTKEQR